MISLRIMGGIWGLLSLRILHATIYLSVGSRLAAGQQILIRVTFSQIIELLDKKNTKEPPEEAPLVHNV